MSRFTSINMNVGNTRITYIMKRREYHFQPYQVLSLLNFGKVAKILARLPNFGKISYALTKIWQQTTCSHFFYNFIKKKGKVENGNKVNKPYIFFKDGKSN